ncbi:MAG: CPBP family intramembrane metalloprotease, partial [Rhodocyclaceae bacterium]|nr:CPBP family intramembrane metalloprotease [Rhodocyclaceae bacterium]
IIKQALRTCDSVWSETFTEDDSDRKLYVVLSSALFGLSHFNQGGHVVIAAGLLGVATALIYLKWRNVWYLIAAHVGVGLVTY